MTEEWNDVQNLKSRRFSAGEMQDIDISIFMSHQQCRRFKADLLLTT